MDALQQILQDSFHHSDYVYHNKLQCTVVNLQDTPFPALLLLHLSDTPSGKVTLLFSADTKLDGSFWPVGNHKTGL